MHYYYDVVANFDTVCWEFYEWDENDEVVTLKKVPFLRVSEKDLRQLLEYDVTFDTQWVQKFLRKTTVKNYAEKASCLLFSSTKHCILLEVDPKGHARYRSKLLIEDENNCNEVAITLPVSEVPYDCHKKLAIRFTFRQEEKEKRFIEVELNTLWDTKNVSKCSYLFYEWFGYLEDNLEQMMKKMKEELQKEYTMKLHEIVLLIQLSYKERL